MQLYSQSIPLRSGATVTVQAWPYLSYSANYLDYRRLMATFRERAGGQLSEVDQQGLLNRVLIASVPSDTDRQSIEVVDLPVLMEAILELNDLEGVAKKLLGLHLRLLQAEVGAVDLPAGTP
ncbi:hypothetical protein [Deinococcus wulumuqiensis]|uniref:hypothetical protein n=1 Tax=Deinococcus wulumuqiensis TaxID=980427 RepID=UPI00242E3437|nr:hypothetical protein [Deinococcus wulumuqiensis]